MNTCLETVSDIKYMSCHGRRPLREEFDLKQHLHFEFPIFPLLNHSLQSANVFTRIKSRDFPPFEINCQLSELSHESIPHPFPFKRAKHMAGVTVDKGKRKSLKNRVSLESIKVLQSQCSSQFVQSLQWLIRWEQLQCINNDNGDVDDAGGDEGSPGCGSSLPTVPMPGTSSLLKIRYKDPNLGKVAMMMMKMMMTRKRSFGE